MSDANNPDLAARIEKVTAFVRTQLEVTLAVTADDIDNGFKDVEVTYRSGRTETVLLTALPHRTALLLMVELFQSGGDTWPLVSASVPAELQGELNGRTLTDRLDLKSANTLQEVAMKLTFGEDFQKKTALLGQELTLAGTPTTSGGPS